MSCAASHWPSWVMFFYSCTFVCWLVTRIAQKLLNGFPRNLDEGWISAQNRPHLLLVRIQTKGQILMKKHHM